MLEDKALRRVLHEPLVHFILIGALLFVADAFLERDRSAVEPINRIQLTLDDLAQLELLFESNWQRQPSQQEFRAMIEERIREEVLYREALTMGLDKDDAIVRRRMAQKMKFLAEDVASAREPTTEELRTWFEDHADLFALSPRLSFRHLYFAGDRRRGHARDDAEEALAQLADAPQDAPRAKVFADPFMFQDYYGDRTMQEIAREFGPAFALALRELTPGAWHGPVESGYGWHLVFVDSVTPGRLPTFEEVAQQVKTAWLGEQKDLAWKKAYDEMRAKYQVLLSVPAEVATASAGVTTGGAADGRDRTDSAPR